MKRVILAMALVLSAAMGAQAAPHVDHARKSRLHRVAPNTSHAVTYDRDSPDPAIGWHWESGMRVCHNDCDNDEIPGSGFTCREVTVMGQDMRECSRQYP
jgi:hypothetical protein